jgi:NAD(P)-dependent dehydrogenase (short-subunit alcohol dehydrogenase family)
MVVRPTSWQAIFIRIAMSIFSDRFLNRTAVITGGASGLGFETARRIAAEGGRVALWDRDGEALKRAQSVIGDAVVHALDVSDAAAVADAATQMRAALGRVDILIASAGITGSTASFIAAAPLCR